MTVRVTDHAVLRYLERVGGYDIDDIRAQMITEDLKLQAKFCPTGKIPVGDGKHMYVIQGGRVVSVVPK